jgi:cytochrome c-type biogenesis protein CcmF
MLVAHIGVAVCILGVGLNTIYSDQRDLLMVPGKVVEQGGYSFHFDGVSKIKGPNYLAEEGNIRIFEDGELFSELKPQKRRYLAGGQVMTEADIDVSFWRDLYVALGEPLADGAWAVRLHYKPFVRWIWLGAILMALGGLLAVLDKRYRRKPQGEAATAAPEASVVSG